MKRTVIFAALAGTIALSVAACGDVEFLPKDENNTGSASVTVGPATPVGQLIGESSVVDVEKVIQWKINTQDTDGKTGFWARDRFNCGTTNPQVTFREITRNSNGQSIVVGRFLTIPPTAGCTSDQVQIFNDLASAQAAPQ